MSHPIDKAIMQRPLPGQYELLPELVAGWIDSVVPSIGGDGRQTADVTAAVIWHLKSRGLSDLSIASAMRISAFKFDFSHPRSHQVHAYMVQLQPLRRDIGAPDHTRLRGKPKPDPTSLMLSARKLDVQFQAEYNAGNHGVARSILKALWDLITQAGEVYHDMEKDRQRIKQVQEEILRNAPNIGRIIRKSGPKEPPAPGPGGRVPNYDLTPRPRVRR